jgi:threonine dehydrogenase-like Zn-dependent dehydrogenase
VEIAAGRAELAGHLGADHLFSPGAGDLATEVRRILGQDPDFVFDCAGAVSTLQLAADLVRPHGRIMLVGVSMKPVPIIPIEWGRKEAEMRSCIAYRDEFPLALDLLAKDRIDVESLISDTVALEDVGLYLRRLLEPDDQVKVLVELP